MMEGWTSAALTTAPNEPATPDSATDLTVDLTGGRVLHSDPHDFAGLYLRHRWTFVQHARGYLNDPRDVEEVVQDAFLRLFLALPELDTELQALAYCRRTITNLCIDRYRATQRRPRLVNLDSVVADQLLEDEPSDPVVRAEDAAVVRAALAQLSPLHRDALVKREIEEKTVPVIAVELDIPEESVKHVLFRARRALRRLLAGTSVAPGAEPTLIRESVRAGGRVAALVAAFALTLGLSAGPDLRMVPVVGDALPDLPSFGDVTAPVGQVFERIGEGVSALSRPQPTRVAPVVPQQREAEAAPRTSLETLLGRPFVPPERVEGGPVLPPAASTPELLAPLDVADEPATSSTAESAGEETVAGTDDEGAPDKGAKDNGEQSDGDGTTESVTASPQPSVSPQPSPSSEPSPEPSAPPSAEPTTEPTAEPTTQPSPEPTVGPSVEPTAEADPQPARQGTGQQELA